MRCLTLADALRAQGAECLFVCRPRAGDLLERIAARGHRVLALPELSRTATAVCPDGPHHADWLGIDWDQDASETCHRLEREDLHWLVVDHYAIDYRWQRRLRAACGRLMVIDDLADRGHDCDLLLDQSLGRTRADYENLVSPGTPMLLGPQFALLRPEFSQLRSESLARRAEPALGRLLITMGGVDKDNATGDVLAALDSCPLPEELRISVVLGPNSPYLGDIQNRAAYMRRPTEVLVGVPNMARLMTESDLAIGAAGGTSWERCCLGLPSFVLTIADNQYVVAESLQNAGAAIAAHSAEEITQNLQARLSSGEITYFLAELSGAAARITDGCGASRVVERMIDDYD